MAEPQTTQQGCSCANLLVPLMMAVGGVVGYEVGGGWWTLLGILAGIPASLVAFAICFGIAAMFEPRPR
jgi:hypothetical protein